MRKPESQHAVFATKWMSCPEESTEFPGLAYLHPLDELIVAEVRENLHNIINSSGKGYTIFNKDGEKVFLAIEQSRHKKFDLKIFNFYGNEVIQVKKPYKLCLNRVLVWAPPGHYIGSVEQNILCKNFLVKNRMGKSVLKIKSRGLVQYVFDIITKEEKIGEIKDQWVLSEVLDVNHFGVSFPRDMGVGDKALLLGGCFLIGCLKYRLFSK